MISSISIAAEYSSINISGKKAAEKIIILEIGSDWLQKIMLFCLCRKPFQTKPVDLWENTGGPESWDVPKYIYKEVLYMQV